MLRVAHCRLFLVLLLVGGLGCAARRAPPPERVPPVRYLVDLQLETSLDWRRVAPREAMLGPLVPVPGAVSPAQPAGAVPPDRVAEVQVAQPDGASTGPDPVAEALAPLASGGLDVVLGIELSLSRRFRDGSLGWLVRFVQAEGHELVPGPAGGEERVAGAALDDWALVGRTVELRTFPDGEVLAVDGARHVAGPDRLGGIVDLLLPLLSPFPPQLEASGTARRVSRWPLVVGPDRGWRHGLAAAWTNHGQDPATAAWHFSYEGRLDGRGRDGAASPPVGVLAEGEARGEVWLLDEAALPVPQRVLGHALEVERRVEVEYPLAAGGPVRVTQRQALRAELRRVGDPGPAFTTLEKGP